MLDMERGWNPVNVRKSIDYSAMFAELDTLVGEKLPQMEMYYEIGRLVSERQEKGAAVAAAESVARSARISCADSCTD